MATQTASTVRAAAFRRKCLFGEDLFDGVQVGWLFWQEEELGSHRANELTHGFAFMAGERPIAIALPSGARWCGFLSLRGFAFYAAKTIIVTRD